MSCTKRGGWVNNVMNDFKEAKKHDERSIQSYSLLASTISSFKILLEYSKCSFIIDKK